jgi:hypothetical protein
MSMEKSSDTVGNQTREPLASNTVPQPTVPLRAPKVFSEMLNINMYTLSDHICIIFM